MYGIIVKKVNYESISDLLPTGRDGEHTTVPVHTLQPCHHVPPQTVHVRGDGESDGVWMDSKWVDECVGVHFINFF